MLHHDLDFLCGLVGFDGLGQLGDNDLQVADDTEVGDLHHRAGLVLGVLPLGFSDGFTRAFSNNFFVTIRGHRCAVIGNICMDHCMIDLCNVPDPQIGEEIVVYGDGVEGADGAMSAQEVADKRGTVVDEVLTNLAARLPRILV